jgi:hypothetical protein
LAEVGAERHVEGTERLAARHHLLRFGHRIPFQRAAADGAGEAAVLAHDHARARFARARALTLRQRHEHGRALLGDEAFDGRPD